MKFSDAVKNHGVKTQTTNGMRARKTTSDANVDLFNVIGSSRGSDITGKFFAALNENEELALRTLLWARDVRGGAGERGTFRKLLRELEKSNPAKAAQIMHKIPELGRWDDLFAYQETANRRDAFDMIGKALNEGNSLCAKWMPREKGTKSAVAKELRDYLRLTPRAYRKLLVNATNVVENKMCAKEWNDINFSHVPSVASARYQKAFGRNAPEAYSDYIRELQKPDSKAKINASAVYPHDVVLSVSKGNKAVANEQWKALPDYVGDSKVLPMVDVSGSMTFSGMKPAPIDIAVSLGLYFSSKTSSDFKDLFMTFSGKPEFVKVKGSLSDKIRQMKTADWGMNTNLELAFKELLSLAKRKGVEAENMPDYILILSDMQFDRSVKLEDSALSMIKRNYADAGYKLPQVVFWNLTGGRYDNTPVKFDKRGTALVSGFSPAILEAVLAMDMENFTPYNVMIRAVMNDRYDYKVH